MAAATSASAGRPPPRSVISHMISHNWLYHNYVISHNGDITVFLHDITYEIMCDTILPFLGSCDVEKKA